MQYSPSTVLKLLPYFLKSMYGAERNFETIGVLRRIYGMVFKFSPSASPQTLSGQFAHALPMRSRSPLRIIVIIFAFRFFLW